MFLNNMQKKQEQHQNNKINNTQITLTLTLTTMFFKILEHLMESWLWHKLLDK